jgi:hypothetical protein
MAKVVYHIVQHDGGWAYKVEDVISETFPTRAEAETAARSAAARQRVPGETEPIEYEDAKGRWHDEVADGRDRPTTEVD